MSDAGGRRQVSTAGYWLAGLAFVVGVAAVVWFVVLLVRLDPLEGAERMAVPGERSLELGAGTWVLYAEHPSDAQAEPLDVEVVGPDGRAVALSAPSRTAPFKVGDTELFDLPTPSGGDYVADGWSGEPLAQFEVEGGDEGTYRLVTSASGPGPARVAVAPPLAASGFTDDAFRAIVVPTSLAMLGFLAAVALVVATAVRRRRPHPGSPAVAAGPAPSWGPPAPPSSAPPPPPLRSPPPSSPPPSSPPPPPSSSPPAAPAPPRDPWAPPRDPWAGRG